MSLFLQFYGFLVLVFLLVLSIRNKNLIYKHSKFFRYYLISGLVLVCISVLSVLLSINSYHFTEILLTMVCKLHFSILILVSFLSLIYIITSILLFDSIYLRLNLHISILLLFLALVLYSDVDFSVNETLSSEALASTIFFIYVFLCFIFKIMYTFTSKSNYRGVIYISLLVEFISVCLAIAFKEITVLEFSLYFSSLIWYLGYESKSTGVDSCTKLFNTETFFDYIDYRYKSGKSYNLLFIFTDNILADYTDSFKRDVRYIVSQTLALHYENAPCFTVGRNEIILVFDTNVDIMSEWKVIRQLIINKLYETKYFRCLPSFLAVTNTDYFNNISDLLDVVKLYRMKSNDIFADNIDVIGKDEFEATLQFSHIKSLIVDALRDDKFVIVLQPIFNMHKQMFTSAEVLVRIEDYEGNLIPPSDFIPVAEKTGLILDIETVVLDKTCKFIKEHPLNSLGLEYLEVNFSVRNCETSSLVDTYKEILEKHGVDAQHINLEITETAIITRRHKLLSNIYKFIDYGISFSLDDYGSGESNLVYMMDIPIVVVKFDRALLLNYFKSSKAKVLFSSSVKMIQQLGIKVLVEGVETFEHYEAMELEGVDYIQGYYFSKPLSCNSFISFILKENDL